MKCKPMQSNREAKREDRDDATGTAKHGREASDRLSHCQPDRERPPRLELKVQTGAHDVAVRLCIEVAVEGIAVHFVKEPLPSSRYIVDPTRKIFSF